MSSGQPYVANIGYIGLVETPLRDKFSPFSNHGWLTESDNCSPWVRVLVGLWNWCGLLVWSLNYLFLMVSIWDLRLRHCIQITLTHVQISSVIWSISSTSWCKILSEWADYFVSIIVQWNHLSPENVWQRWKAENTNCKICNISYIGVAVKLPLKTEALVH